MATETPCYYVRPEAPTEPLFAELLEALDREEMTAANEKDMLAAQVAELTKALKAIRADRVALLRDLEAFRAGRLQTLFPFVAAMRQGGASVTIDEDQAGSGWEPDPDVEAGDLGGEVSS